MNKYTAIMWPLVRSLHIVAMTCELQVPRGLTARTLCLVSTRRLVRSGRDMNYDDSVQMLDQQTRRRWVTGRGCSHGSCTPNVALWEGEWATVTWPPTCHAQLQRSSRYRLSHLLVAHFTQTQQLLHNITSPSATHQMTMLPRGPSSHLPTAVNCGKLFATSVKSTTNLNVAVISESCYHFPKTGYQLLVLA